MQITNAEAIGVEGRGAYYEGAGALRDMMQNQRISSRFIDRNGAANNSERKRRSR